MWIHKWKSGLWYKFKFGQRWRPFCKCPNNWLHKCWYVLLELLLIANHNLNSLSYRFMYMNIQMCIRYMMFHSIWYIQDIQILVILALNALIVEHKCGTRRKLTSENIVQCLSSNYVVERVKCCCHFWEHHHRFSSIFCRMKTMYYVEIISIIADCTT